LFHGTDYQDQAETKTNKTYPLSRFSFEENEMRIDLSGFEFNRTDEDAFKHDYRLFNLKQLENKTDTFHKRSKASVANFLYLLKKGYIFNDTIVYDVLSKKEIIQEQTSVKLAESDRTQLYSIAINNARTNKGRASAAATDVDFKGREIVRMAIEWQRKYSFSFACFVMFLIGAPLGAIVKKGGLGMPVVISVIFFVAFWIISIIGEDMAKEAVLLPYQGMWLSTAFLLPLGMFFTYKATTDSALFNVGAYTDFITNLFKKKEE